MYCAACGKTIPDDAKLCSYCGVQVGGSQANATSTEFVRPREGRRIAGVCLGLARRFGWNVTTLRLVWFLLFLFGGTGGLAYLILWVIMPNEA